MRRLPLRHFSMYLNLLFLLGTIVSAVILLQVSTPRIFGATATTTVTVSPSHIIAALPSRFQGFSFETSSLCNLTSLWDTASFEQLIKNLGPQVVRIGGNSADEAAWSPSGPASCTTSKTVLNQKLIDSFFSLAAKLNTKVIWTLDLGNFDPSSNASEGSYIIKKGLQVGGANGSFLWALGFGNEPDAYHDNGIRPSNWPITAPIGTSSFINDWDAYRNTLRSVPGEQHTKFMGPDIAGNTAYFTALINNEPGILSRTTYHYYGLHKSNFTLCTSPGVPAGCKTSKDLITMLLASSLESQAGSSISTWVGDSGSVPLIVSEANSVNGGGVAGVSDTFASTLWGLDFLFTAWEHGAAGVNFHGGGTSAYTPIAFSSSGQPAVRPLYYAMLAFHQAAPSGFDVRTITNTNDGEVTAHSILDSSGLLRVVIINKDQSNASNVRIVSGGSYPAATIMSLTAPSVSSGTVTLGGKSVSSDGTWNGGTSSLKVTAGAASVTVPRASAVIVTFLKTVSPTPQPPAPPASPSEDNPAPSPGPLPASVTTPFANTPKPVQLVGTTGQMVLCTLHTFFRSECNSTVAATQDVTAYVITGVAVIAIIASTLGGTAILLMRTARHRRLVDTSTPLTPEQQAPSSVVASSPPSPPRRSFRWFRSGR